MSIGVPMKVLHEAEGHIVTCETKTGEVYRGKLVEAEDNMNCQMANITVTYRDGRVAQLENVYIRGSKVRRLSNGKVEKMGSVMWAIIGDLDKPAFFVHASQNNNNDHCNNIVILEFPLEKCSANSQILHFELKFLQNNYFF